MSAMVLDDVYRSLKGLRKLDDARELMAYLNYTYDSTRLSSITLPTTTQDLIAGEPQIIARHGDFRIIHSHFKGDKLLLGHEREIINRLYPDNSRSLFLFSANDYSDWHFVNVKEEQGNRRVLRRITIGEDERIGERLRTPAEQLARIALGDDELDRLKHQPIEIQTRHDAAFDVESVTKRFYEKYREVFYRVEAMIEGIQEPGEKRIFTQRLFNRLMFVAFVQKKGWLRLNGETDYLNALWKSYQQNPEPAGFYKGRLENLFFVALDNKDGRDYMRPGHPLLSVLGDVRYLNGGLFEKTEADHNSAITVPDQAIHDILNDLFNRFNFTITESTPLDQEVAVDPEMLGKVFEELVTGRHETGSYYTPKPIVAFMSREALKAYLRSTLPNEPATAIEAFVDEHQPDGLHDPEAILEALRNVTACDPACGSGAYILGLLHELLELRRCLFSNRQVDHRTDYQRKLEIIQHNLYGVDIDPFAINIARLRLWLSLAIDFEGEKPEPLPNLDFKINIGDSLTTRYVQLDGQTTLLDEQTRKLKELKATYLTAHGKYKAILAGEIEIAKESLRTLGQGLDEGNGFQWQIDFAEIINVGGFDIVLANPPYVRQELIKDLKPRLKDVYGPLYSGTADLYVFFYYRALQLLKPGGALAFISSNKWFRAAYGAKLRKLIAETTDVLSITDFGDLPVFESATAYPMIFTAHKGVPATTARYTEVKSLEPPYPDVNAMIEQTGATLPPSAFDGERWMLTDAATVNLVRTMERDTTPLGEYVNGHIYYGIKTGLNRAFFIDGATRHALIDADPMSADLIKPLAVGKDIRKWAVSDRDQWIIFTRQGTNINDYPAVKEHLSQWRTDLTPKKASHEKAGRKPGSYKWFEIQDNIAYFDMFERPKIIYPQIALSSSFAYDTRGTYTNNKAFIIPIDDFYLLGVLNSQVVWEYLRTVCSSLRGGYLELNGIYLSKLPIPTPSAADRYTISELARTCVVGKQAGDSLAQSEIEINARVARLYGLPEPHEEN